MADALCGPSNALQTFQKHTTVDRTLQQDRLVGRASPTQGFRSSTGSDTGALDAEFDAFQAGRPVKIQPNLHHGLPQFARGPLSQQSLQVSQAPSWATDFQQLSLQSPPAQTTVQPLARPDGAASWHQAFMSQQAQSTAIEQSRIQNFAQTIPGATQYSPSVSFGQTFTFQPAQSFSETVLQPSHVQNSGTVFDEAAFERAFAQAQEDMLATSVAQQNSSRETQIHSGGVNLDRPGEPDPLLARIRRTRPAVYSAIQVWSETGLGRTEEAVSYLDNMHRLETSGDLVQDASEAKWIIDSLRTIVDHEPPQEVKVRAEALITAINQRMMSQYPMGARIPATEEKFWRELDEAQYIKPAERSQTERKQEEKQEQHQKNDADEMAETAGKLLEKVADNTSEKFKNSQFLDLMRKLRDRQVRVEGDKMVDVNEPSVPATGEPASFKRPNGEPNPSLHDDRISVGQDTGVDPNILEYVATDFELPTYDERR